MRMILLSLALVIAVAAPAASDPTAIPAHGIAMHGDTKYGPDFKHFDYVNPDAPKGGTVTLAGLGSFDSLNPFIVKGQAAIGIGGIYDTLTVSSADEPFTHYGLLAETITTPKDRSWVEFKLRAEARWHDGRPVTADDVVFTFDRLVNDGTPLFRFYYGNVERTEKIDDLTVRFVFKPGENRELPLILGQLVVLPKHYWESREFSETTLEPPLGSGPYQVEAVDAGRSIAYRRVEDYWGADLPVNVGQNNFDVIRYEYYRDTTVAVEALKAGGFDFRNENSSKTWATAYTTPAVRQGLLRTMESPHQRTAGMQGFVFNLRREIFKDPRVRRALAYPFDFEWSNRNLFYGQYTRTRSYFDNSELAARGLPGPAELAILEPYRGRVPEEVFTTEYTPPETAGDGRIRENLREADTLLRDAGWVISGKQRINRETGQVLEFEVLLVSPLFERIVLPYAKNLERLGVQVSVRLVDTAQYRRRLDTFDYDMIVFNFAQSESPGNEQRVFWGTAAADAPGSRNFVGIKDPVIDELIEQVIAAPDRENLVTRVRALDRVLQWGHYVVPHFHIPYDRLVFWNKFGRPSVTPASGVQFNAWWVDPEKDRALAAARRN